MSDNRSYILSRIERERERQFMLPGSESDTRKGVNDWLMTATSYIADARQRAVSTPTLEEFEDGLIKAAAVILAGLEHAAYMKTKGLLD